MAQASLVLSDAGRAAIIKEEALIDGLYDDPSGYATFGVGHLVHPTYKWSSFLLAAAIAQPEFAQNVKTRWPGTASETDYLERAVVSVATFDKLLLKARELGRTQVASRRFKGKAFATLTEGEKKIVDGILESAVREEARLLAATGDDILKQDIKPFEKTVRHAVTHDLTQGEFDALVSFAFNVGTGNFLASTLLKKVNANLYRTGTAEKRKLAIDEIEANFRKWNKSGGKVLKGLVSRRQHEADLFLETARKEMNELPKTPAAPTVKPQVLGFESTLGAWT